MLVLFDFMEIHNTFTAAACVKVGSNEQPKCVKKEICFEKKTRPTVQKIMFLCCYEHPHYHMCFSRHHSYVANVVFFTTSKSKSPKKKDSSPSPN